MNKQSSKSANYFLSFHLNAPGMVLSLLALMNPLTVNAMEEQDFLNRDTLSGDWAGKRTALEESGISPEIIYTGEFWRNTSGGIDKKNEYLSNTDISLTLDAEKLWGLKGGTFFFYILGNAGGNPSTHSGDLQGVSNIAAADTYKLYEAWYEQTFTTDNEMSLLFGLYDLNSEFDVIPSGGLFINASQGIGPDLALTGVNGPSIFPTTSLGLRFKTRVNDHGYILTAVWDGVAGNPDNPKGTHIKLDNDDGLLGTLEAGFVIESSLENDERPEAKLAIGTWRYSEKFDDISDTDGFGNPIKRGNNRGFYLLGEYAISRESSNPGRGLSAYARLGTANEDINQIERYLGYGLVYTGLFENRTEDQLGLSVATAFNSDKYRQLTGSEKKETAIELTYRAPVTPWLTIQPDIQYIINPGTDPAIKNALVAGMRFEITL